LFFGHTAHPQTLVKLFCKSQLTEGTDGSLFNLGVKQCADITVWGYSHWYTLKHKQTQISVKGGDMCVSVLTGNWEQA